MVLTCHNSFVVISRRRLTLSRDNAFENLRKQYLKRRPEANPLGTIEEPVEWSTLGLGVKVSRVVSFPSFPSGFLSCPADLVMEWPTRRFKPSATRANGRWTIPLGFGGSCGMRMMRSHG